MFATEITVSIPTYCTNPGISKERRHTQENASTQTDTSELSGPEKKKWERWS